MVWQKRVHIYSASGIVNRIRESDLLQKIQSSLGSDVQKVHTEARNIFNLTVLISFREKKDADCLDKTMLTEIITELLEDEDVEIHIEAGGAGTL